MKKILSNIVVFLLLIIAPVSFSTEEIPCFDVPGVEGSTQRNKQKNSLAILQQTKKLPLSSVNYTLPENHNSPSPSTPKTVHILEIPHGRAPPLSIPVA